VQQTNAVHDRPVKSLDQFKARMCDCGNPICFGSFTSQDVAWLVRYAERLKRKVARRIFLPAGRLKERQYHEAVDDPSLDHLDGPRI